MRLAATPQPLLENSARMSEQVAFDVSAGRAPYQTWRGFWMVGRQYERLAQIEGFGPNLKGNVEAGLKLNATDYAAAEQTRMAMFDRFHKLFERYDVLLTPAAPVKPYPVKMNFPDTINGSSFENYIDWIAPAYLITLVSLPAATAPAGLSQDGLPIGMQIVAPRFEEPLILRVARLIHRASNVGRPPLLYEDEEANAEGGEAVRGRQGRLSHRHRQLRLDARGRPARRARRQADRHHGIVRGLHHRRPLLALTLSRERPRRAAGPRSRSGCPEKPQAKVFYLGPDYEMDESTVAAFKASAEKVGASTGLVRCFAPLDAKDYTQYFGRVRAARPQVLYTSVAGNDTVRLLSQMQEFGLLQQPQPGRRLGQATSRAIRRSGRRPKVSPASATLRPRSVRPRTRNSSTPSRRPTGGARSLRRRRPHGCDKAAVEKAKSTETDKVREAPRGLKWMTPQGEKTIRAGAPRGGPDHVRGPHHR